MIEMSHFPRKLAGIAAVFAVLTPLAAAAQTLEYGDVGASGEAATDGGYLQQEPRYFAPRRP